MKSESDQRHGDASDEVAALIETLHASGQRLEDLTAGEVDAVSNRNGRTVLLRRAQDHFRQNEAAKQTAILDALPAHIALLDNRGFIISVNEAWRQFATINELKIPNDGIGLNYLDHFDNTLGHETPKAREIAEGIRAVLRGVIGHFSCEYSCPTPTEQGWFQMTASPLAGTPPNGAVITHFNITQQKYGEETLRRFVAAMDAIADAIYLIDRPSMRFVHVNAAACRMQNQTRAELLAQAPWNVFPSSRADLEHTYDEIIKTGQEPEPQETRRRRDDGSQDWMELRHHVQRSEDRWNVITLERNITERKQAEDRIVYLNRVYAMLSGINTLIVHEIDRDKLFTEACRLAVHTGGFRMAWIGVIDQRVMKTVLVASAGVPDQLLSAIKTRLTTGDAETLEDSLTEQAVREKKTVVSNDSQHDRRRLFGQEYAESDVRSMAILPLIVLDEVIGVFVLCASEIDFFQDEELKLLTELADDIAFAIDHIHKHEQLSYLAYYDVLTGLANRTLFLERVAQSMRSAVSGGHRLAVFLFDLERFKNINDSLGLAAGDALLIQVARWFTQQSGDAGLLARVGPDLFATILPEIKQEGDVARLIETTMDRFQAHPFRLNDTDFRVAVKAGIALFPDDSANAEGLFRNAEAALKKAKKRGERYQFYTQGMTESVALKLTLENQLRQALDNGEFELYYQPKVNLASGRLTGAEALIRWNDPRTGLVPPAQFIPILEETGLINQVGRWALKKALEDHLRWRSTGRPAVRIAVNVSPLQLRSRSLIAEIRQAIGIDSQGAAGLELEITESLIMEDARQSITSLQDIRAMGIRIAIDDFGTGFSSLSYLSRLPVDTLKIDQSFVNDMTESAVGLSLVATIINLAHALKLKVVAEGVETEEQKRLLRVLNCDEVQGYLFSKPLPCAVFESTFLNHLASGQEPEVVTP